MEEFRQVKGFENYSVSSLGKVRRDVDRGGREICRPLKLSLNRAGYCQVNPSVNGAHHTQRVHRLVAQAFIPNPDSKREVNHKNGIKTDNRVVNLEWVTAKENGEHSSETGLAPRGLRHGLVKDPAKIARGEQQGNSRLTVSDIRTMRRLRADGSRLKDIARRFGVSIPHTCRIVRCEYWTHVK